MSSWVQRFKVVFRAPDSIRPLAPLFMAGLRYSPQEIMIDINQLSSKIINIITKIV